MADFVENYEKLGDDSLTIEKDYEEPQPPLEGEKLDLKDVFSVRGGDP